jgi:very-short-patch-repair endonuclease
VNDYARELRNNSTKAERRLWGRLQRRQLGGFKFRRQRPVGPYICDFVCLEASMVIELDGSQHVAQAPYNANRDSFLRSNGFRVLRFWNGDVLSQTDTVVETIYEALHRQEMDGRFD